MKFLILLALIGLSAALQPKVQYEFEYRGDIKTVIPKLRSQSAAGSLSATVMVNMRTKTSAVVQLSDVKVGTYHDDIPGGVRTPIKFDYSALTNVPEITEPFIVNFDAKEGSTIMQSSKSEPEWVTNLKKSVVQPLKTSTRGDLVPEAHMKNSHAMSIVEGTLFGTCDVLYAISPLPSKEAEKEEQAIKQHLKADIQGKSQKSGGAPGEQLWSLVKIINTERCYDAVVLQHSAVGNISHFRHGQFEVVSSSSHASKQILRGMPGQFRLERANTESTVTLRPFGLKSEEIHSISNQTLLLKEVKPYKEPSQPKSLKTVQTLMFGVVSPNSPSASPKNRYPWVHFQGEKNMPMCPETFMTGMPLTEQIMNKYVKNIEELLEQAATEVQSAPKPPQSETSAFGTSTGVMVERLHMVTRSLNCLSKAKIEQVFSKIFSESGEKGNIKKVMLVDVLSTSGSQSAIKVLLNNISKLSDARATTVFLTMPNNIHEPRTVTEDILPAVQKLDIKRNPLQTATALLSAATMTRKLCVRQDRNSTVMEGVLGEQQDCSNEKVLEFLHSLQSKLESASEPWEQTLYVKCMAMLGLRESLGALKKHVESKEVYPKVKIAAVRSLHTVNLPNSLRNTVCSMLWGLVTDRNEPKEVRMVSAKVLLDWKPEVYYKQLATYSWIVDTDMSSYIYSLVHGVATARFDSLHHQTKMAKAALPLCKRQVFTPRYSYDMLAAKTSQKLGLSTFANFGWIYGDEYSDISAALKAKIGEYHLSLLETTVNVQSSSAVFEAMKSIIMSHASQAGSSVHTPGNRRKAANGASFDSELMTLSKSEIDIFVQVFENLHYYLPLNQRVMEQMFEGSSLKELLSGQKKTIGATKYFNPAPMYIALPSLVGCPTFVSIQTPTMHVAEGSAKVMIPGISNPTLEDLVTRAKEVQIQTDIDWRVNSKVLYEVRTTLPWVNKTVAARIEAERAINLPVKAEIRMTRPQQPQMGSWNVSVAIEPKQQEVPVVYAHSIPSTCVKSLFSNEDILKQDIKPIFRQKSRQPLVQEVQSAVGETYMALNGEFKFTGDVESPIEAGHLIRILQKPQHLLGSPLSGNSLGMMRATLINKPGQAKVAKVQCSNQKHSFQIQQSPKDLHMDYNGTLTCQVETSAQMNGAPLRWYALSAKLGSESTEQKTTTTVQLSGARGPTPKDSAQKMMCMKLDVESPAVNTLNQLVQAVKSSQLSAKIEGQIVYGKTCVSEQQTVAKIQATASVSEKRRQELVSELSQGEVSTAADPTVNFPVQAVYDHVDAQVQYEQSLPKSVRNVTLQIYDMIKALSFPYVSSNRMVESPEQNKIIVSAQRPISQSAWMVFVRTPIENTEFKNLHVPRLVERIVPIGGYAQPNQCEMTLRSIQTFDKVLYANELTKCFAVVATGSDQKAWEILAARKESGLEAKLVAQGAQVEITATGIKVDGQQVKLTRSPVKHGKVFVKAEGQYKVVRLPNTVTVRVSPVHMTVKVDNQKLRGQMKGLCGDFNGMSKADLAGQKGEVYKKEQARELITSWTVAGGQCNAAQLNERKTHALNTLGGGNCNVLKGFKVLEVGSRQKMLCITKHSIPVCRRQCKVDSFRMVKEQFKCFEESKAPEQLKEALRGEGFLEEQVPEQGVERVMEWREPTKCSQ